MISVIENFIPKAIKNLKPFQSARMIGDKGHIYLNANELSGKNFLDSELQSFNRYPSLKPEQLSEAYLNYSGAKTGCIATRGADEAIDLVIRSFCEPIKDSILVCPPTYGMYEVCAKICSINAISVPLNNNFQLDMLGISAKLSESKVLFICSPNNPTGNLINRKDIIELLNLTKNKTLVVVDEAYIEFSSVNSVLDLVESYPNLIIIRTMSKAFGMAAIRCGFILAHDDVINNIRKIIAPFPIPDPCANIALIALSKQNIETMMIRTNSLIDIKNKFCEKLVTLNCVEIVYPTHTNFVLVKFNTNTFKHLLNQGIVCRNQNHEKGLTNCIRITIGLDKEMDETINALKNYISVESLKVS
jgi:histidinol-phosphate aminotransferase